MLAETYLIWVLEAIGETHWLIVIFELGRMFRSSKANQLEMVLFFDLSFWVEGLEIYAVLAHLNSKV